MSFSSWTASDPSPTYRTVRAVTERALGISYHRGSGFVTDDLGLEDVVECPHCGGVISSPWEDHSPSCPAGGYWHCCRECDGDVDGFAVRRL